MKASRQWREREGFIHKKLIIAHRGAPSEGRENTIESFDKAIALGADMIEFDVRRTKDEIFIVYHDEFIQNNPVKESTFETISRIARSQRFHIPTVEEVLKATRGRIKLDVELKEEGYEEEIVELVSKYFEEDEFIITSFNDASLKTIKDHFPRMWVGLLLGKFKASVRTRVSEFFPTKRCENAKADFLGAHVKLLRFGFLGRAQRKKIPVVVWTVNDEETIWKLLRDGRVHGIVTDKTGLAVSLQEKLDPSHF